MPTNEAISSAVQLAAVATKASPELDEPEVDATASFEEAPSLSEARPKAKASTAQHYAAEAATLQAVRELYEEGMQGLSSLSADLFSDPALRAGNQTVLTLRRKFDETCERRYELESERDRAADVAAELIFDPSQGDDSPAARALCRVEVLDGRVEHASADVLMCQGALVRALREREELAEPYRSRAIALAKFVMAAQAYYWAEHLGDGGSRAKAAEMVYLPIELPRWVTSDEALEGTDVGLGGAEPERLVG
ncbi:MAG TPA: hypothetical protein VK277_14435 [Acidimicrobiales bacterium]|nr:hypothetical protein [Acidimicrobiales bacterium]